MRAGVCARRDARSSIARRAFARLAARSLARSRRYWSSRARADWCPSLAAATPTFAYCPTANTLYGSNTQFPRLTSPPRPLVLSCSLFSAPAHENNASFFSKPHDGSSELQDAHRAGPRLHRRLRLGLDNDGQGGPARGPGAVGAHARSRRPTRPLWRPAWRPVWRPAPAPSPPPGHDAAAPVPGATPYFDPYAEPTFMPTYDMYSPPLSPPCTSPAPPPRLRLRPPRVTAWTTSGTSTA